MSNQTWQETLITAQVDGPTLTAAAAATCLPAAALYTLPANFFKNLGQQIRIRMHGRISCVVTTPGTARFDVRLGGTVVFDTAAMNLNIVAKTNVPWELEMLLTLRALGSSANLIGVSRFTSEAVVGSPLPSAGGNGVLLGPVGSAPAVGNNFNSGSSQQLDVFFTQTVATGSLTVHQYALDALN